MARPPKPAVYKRQAWQLFDEGLLPGEVERRLRQWAADQSKEDPDGPWESPNYRAPSLRWIERQRQDWAAAESWERALASLFRWPRSMLEGGLPWEASEAALDLLAWHLKNTSTRPTVLESRWFWRLRLARPSMSVDQAAYLAISLAVLEHGLADGEDLVNQIDAGLDSQLAVGQVDAWLGWNDRGKHGLHVRQPLEKTS